MGPFKRRQSDGTRHHIRSPEQEVGSSLWGACNKVVRMQHPPPVVEKVGALISEGDWQPGLSSQVRYILISRSCGISVLGQINSRPRTFSLHYSMFAVAEWARATVSFGISQDGLLVRVRSARRRRRRKKSLFGQDLLVLFAISVGRLRCHADEP